MIIVKRNLNNAVVGYKKLVLYSKSKELVLLIYELTKKFPKTELYSLVPQMRRAAISVLANIVEGYAKGSSKEYARFLTISIGSVTELEVYIDISFELGYINIKESNEANNIIFELKKLLYGSRKKVLLKIHS
ncbi:MAG: S23 ribosomal protein [Candidatus Woesebacteria bacterium GW2011_GWA1_37_7]|uniref:S23 ribosomal protein n=1 Tax=Candidatus Woesebacteria bacterium GW2011_GWA1_37_7 TaxID=1618545 RepID=A0A0G0HB24_9BACT|nr:MAG: S23 ribosomal protein [Candidatus Woesebacteria bacterium GW2011_GWA1_37_7]